MSRRVAFVPGDQASMIDVLNLYEGMPKVAAGLFDSCMVGVLKALLPTFRQKQEDRRGEMIPAPGQSRVRHSRTTATGVS